MSRSARVTAFPAQADGARNYAVTVDGLRVLITASDGRHDAGADLAAVIAALGPEGIEAPVASPTTAPAMSSATPPAFVVGQRVRCIVHGAEGPCVVLAVGMGRHRGRIKIDGVRSWCPAHNFRAEVSP